MITKAIVDDVSDKYEIKVRIPILDRASVDPRYVADAYLPSAPICTLPNTGLNLRKGDVVWVAFENGDQSRPVVVGCLYMDKVSETEASIILNSLSVSADAELPQNTTIGEVSSEELGYLKGLESNVQAQIDEINNVIGGDVADVPVIKSNGRDSLVQKTVNIPEDVDTHGNPIDRTNVANGAFSCAFGSRNTIYAGASESGAFGGDIHIFSENTYGFGYHIWAWENQNLLGGYDVGSNAKESFIFGNTIGIGCNHNASNRSWSPSTDHNLSRYIGAVGEKITIGYGCYADFVVGRGHTVGNYVTDSIVAGQKNTLGNELGWCNVFGDYNSIGNNVKETTVFGWENTVAPGASTSDKTKNIFLFGHENTNKDKYDTTKYNDIYAMGHGLIAGNADEVVLGRWNSGLTGESSGVRRVLEVGDGTSASVDDRNTCFGIVRMSNGKYKMWLGDVSITETELYNLLH